MFVGTNVFCTSCATKETSFAGLADPYVKGQLGAYRFKTMTQKGTLVPKWFEEFKIPIVRWDFLNVLAIEVWDECHSLFDFLGLTKNQNHFLGFVSKL